MTLPSFAVILRVGRRSVVMVVTSEPNYLAILDQMPKLTRRLLHFLLVKSLGNVVNPHVYSKLVYIVPIDISFGVLQVGKVYINSSGHE